MRSYYKNDRHPTLQPRKCGATHKNERRPTLQPSKCGATHKNERRPILQPRKCGATIRMNDVLLNFFYFKTIIFLVL